MKPFTSKQWHNLQIWSFWEGLFFSLFGVWFALAVERPIFAVISLMLGVIFAFIYWYSIRRENEILATLRVYSHEQILACAVRDRRGSVWSLGPPANWDDIEAHIGRMYGGNITFVTWWREYGYRTNKRQFITPEQAAAVANVSAGLPEMIPEGHELQPWDLGWFGRS